MKKVIVIGGGFAGALTAKKLEKKKDFKVTIIDTKNYFEFTPSILRTIVEPEHIKKIQILHNHYLHKSKIITDQVVEISERYVKLKSGKKVEFDYLVIASGSKYELPIKEQNLVVSTRASHLRDCYEKLCRSKSILIIGGGLVGVELAGEILDHYKKDNKKITIVHSAPEIIPRNNKKTIIYADRFLQKKGVEIIKNERVVKSKNNGKRFITDKNRVLKPDIAFLCTGIKPNFEFLKKNFSKALNEKNQVKVNSFLQVKKQGKVCKNIFAAGDITDLKEEKTAQNSENHALIVSKNICAIEDKKSLHKYESNPRVMVISLGKKNGILTYKNLTFGGLIPAMMKGFIEWKTMLKYRY